MAAPSNMIPLGTIASNFTLFDTRTNQLLSLSTLKSNVATVVMFLCNHCPYVRHLQPKIVEVANRYQAKGIQFIAISANDAEMHPEDGPDQMRLEAKEKGYTFPYLYDESQAVAKAYQAACTPDFYVFDRDLRCVYRGRFDGATPRNDEVVTGVDLCAALDNVLAGKAVDEDQKASLGCSIKWK